MSDEPFLTRWSRRKREADHDADAQTSEQATSARPRESGDPEPESVEREAAVLDSRLRGNERGEAAGQTDVPEVDLSKLPPIDSIDATTDIRAFLARGVPASLTQAALRRAWAADPAIRDFVGLVENGWDFTAPETIPGFGPLLPADEMAAQAANQVRGLASSPAPELSSESQTEMEVAQGASPPSSCDSASHTVVNNDEFSEAEINTTEQQSGDRIADKQREDVAARNISNDADLSGTEPRRRHGGALPT